MLLKYKGDIFEFLVSLRKELKKNDDLNIIVDHPDFFAHAISLKSWIDLAEAFGCKVAVPKVLGESSIEMKWSKSGLFVEEEPSLDKEKYGAQSNYFKLNKFNEVRLVFDFLEALKFVKLKEGDGILDLGCHRGDFLEMICSFNSIDKHTLTFLGIDYCESALEIARNKFKALSAEFFCRDLMDKIRDSDILSCDLLMSVGTLQCTSLDGPEVFKKYFQATKKKTSKVILGFPNCKYREGSVEFGARTKNYQKVDMSLVLKDVMYYKKYLQQHGFRVWITGKNYIFLAAKKQ